MSKDDSSNRCLGMRGCCGVDEGLQHRDPGFGVVAPSAGAKFGFTHTAMSVPSEECVHVVFGLSMEPPKGFGHVGTHESLDVSMRPQLRADFGECFDGVGALDVRNVGEQSGNQRLVLGRSDLPAAGDRADQYAEPGARPDRAGVVVRVGLL